MACRPGGAADYDDLDAPIGPLQAHYHTRGALYYTARGVSAYDRGVEGLTSGELRFVQTGFYYGLQCSPGPRPLLA